MRNRAWRSRKVAGKAFNFVYCNKRLQQGGDALAESARDSMLRNSVAIGRVVDDDAHAAVAAVV